MAVKMIQKGAVRRVCQVIKVSVFGLFAQIPFAYGVELSFSSLRIDAGYGYALDAKTTLETALELNLETEFELSQSWDFVLSGRARFDAETRLLDPEDSFASYTHVSRPVGLGDVGYAELRDAYFEYGFDNGLVRFGKQQIVWGALDGLKVTDVLNPQSFREFILEPFDESRIGTLAAYSDITINDLRMEFAWLPDETTHDLGEPGDWFEFTAPRFRLGQDIDAVSPLPVGQGFALSGNPGADLGRWGVRLSAPVKGVAVTAIASNTLDFEPTVLANGATLTRRFHDLRLYGLTLEGAAGPFALRAEAAYRPRRFFNALSAAGLVEERRDQWSVALAADFNAPFDTFINVQLLADRVDKGEPGNELVRPREDILATVLIRKKFLYDTLTLDLRWYADLQVDDGLYRVELGYAISDTTALKFNYDGFYGASQGVFGQFSERDRVGVVLTHTF